MGKLQEALRRAERSSRQFMPFYKFPVGKTDLRILPACKADGPEDWFLPVGLHYNLNDKQPIVCREETNWMKEACPVCAAVIELRAAGQNDEAQRISLRKQYLVRAIVRGQEDKGAQIVRLPTTVFQQVGKIVQEEETFGEVLSPSPKGRDIRVIKSGSGLNTEYSVQALPQTRPALGSAAEVKAVMEKLTPILTLVDIPSEKEVEKIVEAKLGFSIKGGGFGSPADEDWDGEDEGDGGGDWGDSKEPVKDDDEDWGDEQADIPFDQSKSVEKEEAPSATNDDDWLDSDTDDDDIDFNEVIKSRQTASTTQVSGLTEGLSKELEKHTAEPQRKRGKSRQRIGA